ncbi:MAG: BA14K family protein [Rhizobiaceae bacterium]|nr:BA14K family protein [Rhizobiaceae bacterium]
MAKKLLSGLCATALAATFAVTGTLPLAAAPYVPQASVPAAPDVTLVQERGDNDMMVFPRDQRRWFREAARDRRDMREARRDWRDDSRFHRRGDRYYYNGYRGYRDHRPGYRQYNGFWFPAAAFIAGALITGAITADRGSSRSAHVEWCYDRYRSYRASDNTFQPYDGGRRQCYSPYSR